MKYNLMYNFACYRGYADYSGICTEPFGMTRLNK